MGGEKIDASYPRVQRPTEKNGLLDGGERVVAFFGLGTCYAASDRGK